MKRFKILIVLILILALFVSCGERLSQKAPERAFAPGVAREDKAKVEETPAESGSRDVTSERKIIRTANVSLYVTDFEQAAGQIQSITRQFNGIIANKSFYRNQSYIQGSMTLWVPSEKLVPFVNEISKVGKVRSSNITAEDISDQYYDLQARLESKKKQEKRLLSLLDKPDTSLDELLKLEQELARVRGEIESMEGRKRKWDQQVAYSTVEVNLTQDVKAVKEPDDIWKPLRRALRNAKPTFLSSFGALVRFIGGLITVIIALIPWIVLLIVLIWVWKSFVSRSWKKFWTRRKKKKEEAKQEKSSQKEQPESSEKPEKSEK